MGWDGTIPFRTPYLNARMDGGFFFFVIAGFWARVEGGICIIVLWTLGLVGFP